MAVTLKKTLTINLNSVVANSIQTVKNVRRVEQARKEGEFQKAIADGLSYDEQVKLREEQLNAEKASPFSDPDYVLELEKSITTTKKLARFHRYRERYTTTLADLSSGKINEEQYLVTLKDSLSGVTDPDLILEIQKDVAAAEGVVKQYRDTILNNQVKKAKFDGTEKALDEALAKVKIARSNALISDNQDEVTAYDETISALESQLFGIRVQDSLSDFTVQSSTKGVSPIEKLNYLNSELKQADANVPIRIGNVSYRSAQEFWTLERDGYLAGTSQTFGNFFDEMAVFTQNKVNANVVSFGYPPQAVLDDTFATFNDLKGRPEFAPFVNQLDITQATVMADAVDKFAKKVIDSSETALQFEAGVNQLNNLGTKYGVNTEIYSSQLFQRARGLEQSGLIPEGTAAKVAAKVGVEIPEITTESKVAPSAGGAPVSEKTKTVVSGDTLSDIAKGANITLAQLLDLNPQFKENPNLIKPGQQVNLPPTTDTIPTEPPSVVKPPTPTQPTPTPAPTPAQPTPTLPPTPEPPAPTAPKFTGTSIVDFLKSVGQDSSFENRAKLAAEQGIQNYTGTASQNTQLLNILNK